MEIKIINKSKHQLPTYATELSAGMDKIGRAHV